MGVRRRFGPTPAGPAISFGSKAATTRLTVLGIWLSRNSVSLDSRLFPYVFFHNSLPVLLAPVSMFFRYLKRPRPQPDTWSPPKTHHPRRPFLAPSSAFSLKFDQESSL